MNLAASPDVKSIDTVNIRPGVTVLSVLRHLNYRPWFALAEFVDNSLQSFTTNHDTLCQLHGADFVLRIEIEIQQDDGGRITVRDNAGGIPTRDYGRAFRPAQLPTDRTGLAEFGMGMKSAACWFSPTWQVRTSALREPVVRTVGFDIDRIVTDGIEELHVEESEIEADAHFTEITLQPLHKPLVGRTLRKIKDHLTDIYRMYLRDGDVQLSFNGDILVYAEPKILIAPPYDENRDPIGESVEWRVDLDDFDFGNGLSARGFAAILQKASTQYAGFSLFRRNRLIEGSSDEKYRPRSIFGNPNDFVYQRLFGELHLEGFEVSHTKDGFRWDDNEEPFLDLLKERLNDPSRPLIRQARNYRVRPTRQALKKTAEAVSNRTAKSLEEHGTRAVEAAASDPVGVPTPENLPVVSLASQRVVDFDFEERQWRVILELTDDPAIGEWFELAETVTAGADGAGRELLGLRLSLRHPFMERFVGADRAKLEPIVRIATALGLAEKVSRDAGVKQVGSIRRKLNKVLTVALSRSD